MYSLADAYEKGSGTTFMTITMGVVTSLLFTTGLFLILNAHSSNQSKQLEQTIAAIKKNLTHSGDSSNAALLSLEASLAAQEGAKTPVTLPPINNLDTLTVKGASTLQGSVKAGKDLSVGGNLDTKANTSVGGNFSVAGTAEFADTVTTDSDLQVAGNATIGGDASADSLTLNSDLTIGGDLQVSGDSELDGDLSVDGLFSTDSLSLTSDASVGGDLEVSGATQLDSGLDVTGDTTTDTLTTTSDGSIGGDLDVTGDETIGGNLDVTGTFTQGGSDLSDLFIQNAPSTAQSASINIDGDINSATLTTTQDATIGDDLMVTGDVTGATLTTTGDVTVGDKLAVTGDVTVGGDLAVTGDITGATLTTDTDASIGGNLDVTGGGSIGGDLDVSGAITQGGNNLSDLFLGINDSAVGINVTSTSFATSTVTANGHVGRTRNTCTATQHLRINQVDAGIITGLSDCIDDTNSSGVNYDLAENYPSSQGLSPGDVVKIDPASVNGVIKSTSPGDGLVIGVVSTAPAITLGSAGPGYPIALSGRVPVNVTNEGGAIAPGDYLTSSSTPGYAKKAAFGDKTIGQALASFAGVSGSVSMFVSIGSENNPPQNLIQSTQLPGQLSDASFNSLNVSGSSTLSNLQVTGTATIKDLQVTGTATVATLTVSGHIIGNDDTRGIITIPAGSVSVHHDFANAYATTPVLVASPDGQPVAFSATPTATGFDIKLLAPVATDVKFDYLVQQ